MTSLQDHIARSRAHRQPRQTLDAWLKSRSDRCDGCGSHVPSQGHAADCAPVAPEWTGAVTPAEWATFTDALTQVARGGEVHQRDMRPLIRGRIQPTHIASCYRKAIALNLIREVRRERSNDAIGRNTNKDEPVYELKGAA